MQLLWLVVGPSVEFPLQDKGWAGQSLDPVFYVLISVIYIGQSFCCKLSFCKMAAEGEGGGGVIKRPGV